MEGSCGKSWLESAKDICTRKVRSDGFTPEELFENLIVISDEQRAAFEISYDEHEQIAGGQEGLKRQYHDMKSCLVLPVSEV